MSRNGKPRWRNSRARRWPGGLVVLYCAPQRDARFRMAATDWRSFWDGAHSIYVNAHHKDVHYRAIAEQIAAFVPGPNTRVLDFGCGEALHADLVAAVAGEVMLSD